jgi:hypothetical protein
MSQNGSNLIKNETAGHNTLLTYFTSKKSGKRPVELCRLRHRCHEGVLGLC